VHNVTKLTETVDKLSARDCRATSVACPAQRMSFVQLSNINTNHFIKWNRNIKNGFTYWGVSSGW